MKLIVTFLLCISTSTFAQVRISFEGDTLKGNIKKMTEHSYSSDKFSNLKLVYTSDITSRSETAVFYDEHDSNIGKLLIKFDDYRHVIEKSLYCLDDTPCQVFTYSYDLQNRKIEERSAQHLNRHCNEFIDLIMGSLSNWVTGTYILVNSRKYKYDNLNRLIEMKEEISNIGGNPGVTTETTNYKYNSENKVVQIKKECSDIDVFGSVKSRTKTTNTEYDTKGNKVDETTTNKDYQSWRQDSTRTLFRYDDQNNLVETKSYFPVTEVENSKPHSGKKVGAGSDYTYDRLNNMASSNYYDLYRADNGLETKDVMSSQKNKKRQEDQKEYDKQGNIIKIKQWGTVIFTREIEYY